MKKTLLSLIMLTSIGIYSTQAQITVNSGDVVGSGDVVEQAQDTLPTVTIGGIGGNQTWNFASLAQHTLDTLSFKNPWPLPGSSSFPIANIGLTDSSQDSSWIFLDKNSAGLFILGQTTFNQGNLITLNSPSTLITFPSTMGTNFNNNWNGIIAQLFVGQLGVDSVRVTRGVTVNSNIDAWGNVTTPFGTFPSIRQNVIEQNVDTTWVLQTGIWSVIDPLTASAFNIDPIAFDTIRTARWWSDDPTARFPLVEMDYEANGTVNNVHWQKSTPTVGVTEQVVAVSGVVLYPNPASTEITIETSLTDNNSIKILDVTGKLISDTRFNTKKITLSVSDFDNGIYFYNIYDVAGNVIHSNKFVVAK